jgi:hypothetical protein
MDDANRVLTFRGIVRRTVPGCLAIAAAFLVCVYGVFPENPDWAQLLHGRISLGDWLWPRGFGGCILLAFMVGPGVELLIAGLREIRKARQEPEEIRKAELPREVATADRLWFGDCALGTVAAVIVLGIGFEPGTPRILTLIGLTALLAAYATAHRLALYLH